MNMLKFKHCFSGLLGLLLCLCAGTPIPVVVAQQSPKAAAGAGQSTFNSACAGCHGLDGRGSDKAVNITGPKMRHLSNTQLAGIITEGVPGTGMPGFRTLSDRQVRAVVSYLRSLQGKSETRMLPGDAMRGKTVFFGKGECSTCHFMSGEGGFMGPDLSGYGSTVSAEAIRDQILRTQRSPAEGFRPAVLTTRDGARMEGVIRNEDNFTLQLQTRDGSFHSFQKSELQKLEHLETSLMPTNYGGRLSPDELNDLVSYLMNAGPDASRGTSRKKKEDWDE